MKILFVTPRLPLPANTGAKIRTYNLLRQAKVAGNDITLLTFVHSPDDKKHLRAFEGMGIEVIPIKVKDRIDLFTAIKALLRGLPLNIAKYDNREMAEVLNRLASNDSTGFRSWVACRKLYNAQTRQRKTHNAIRKTQNSKPETRNYNGIDLVHFDHLHMGQYRDCVNGKPCVLDEHNIESVLLDRCAKNSGNIVKKQLFKSQARKMAVFEAELVNRVTKCLVVSDNDKERLAGLLGRNDNIEVIPNGVDTRYFKPKLNTQYSILNTSKKGMDTEYFRSQEHPLDSAPLATLGTLRDSLRSQVTRAQGNEIASPATEGGEARNDVVFTGSMDWLPNSDAVEYFCKDILPLIWKGREEAKFYVVGKNPTKKIKEFGKKDKRIVVTGEVEDVRPYIEKAKVFVVPIRIGGGTRLKILEAMSMQKAVVSTAQGAEGIDYKDGFNILIADTPPLFANSVLLLLRDSNKAEGIGLNGRKLVCNKYDWNIIGGKLNKVYGEVARC